MTIVPGVMARLLIEGRGTAMMLYRIEPGTRLQLHRHPFPELGVVLAGEGRVTMPDGERVVRVGDSYYIPPNSEHGWAMPTQGEPVVLVDVSSELGALDEEGSRDAAIELARAAARRYAPEFR